METQRICPNCRKPLPPDVPLGLCPECLIKSGFPTEAGSGAPGEAAGARFVPPPVEEIAQLFPQLEILDLIGKGGMGAVYKARQPALDRLVALKILPPAVASDSGFAERFNREARALARLNHPNIVAIYDFGIVGPAPRPPAPDQTGETLGKGTLPPLHYLLMEFVDGTNLRGVEHAGKLSPEQALAIIPQICEALQFAHNEGVVHRDIKPENILLDKKGRVKITDFGIAKIVGLPTDKVSLTGTQDVVGTPHYMAPEQIEKPQAVDHRADIYSLGVVFYEMLTGELPLGKFSPPSKKVQVDVRLDEVVLHSLEKEPSRRYQQASQVKTDVETIAGTAAPVDKAAAFSAGAGQATSDKAILPALLLAFPFGLFGAHRFYVGKTGTAFLQLSALVGCILLIVACAHGAPQPLAGLLLGFLILGCFIWAVTDWILILCKAFTDGQGRRMTHWLHSQNDIPKSGASPMSGFTSGPPPGGAAPPAGTGPQLPPMASKVTSAAGTGMIVAPAVGLIVAAIWKLFSALLAWLFLAGMFTDSWLGNLRDFGIGSFSHFGALAGSSILLFKVIPALLILFGALQMMRLRSYAWALAAAILSIVACSLIGLPMGIWALIVLAREDVRETFAHAARSTPSRMNLWPWALGTALVAGVFILIALGLKSAGDTPNVTVTGIVIDAASGQAIAGARVDDNRYGADSDKAPAQAWTDTNGYYVLSTRYEEHTIAASAPGYQTTLSTLRTKPFGSERDVRMNFSLPPATRTPPPAAANQVPVTPEVPDAPPPATPPESPTALAMATPTAASAVVVPVSPAAVEASAPPKTNRMSMASPVLRKELIANLSTTDPFQQDFNQTLPLSAQGRLRLDNVNGRIEIVGGNRDEVVIQALKHGKTRESVEATRIKVDASPDEISIHTEEPPNKTDFSGIWYWFKSGEHDKATVDYAIQVPHHARLANISSVNGRVKIDDVGGDIEASTVNGAMEVQHAAGSLKLSTVNGRIETELISLGGNQSISLTTVNGAIETSLPVNADAEVSADTLNGGMSSEFPELAVKTDFPLSKHLKGTLGHGGATVKATTVNGRISFHKGPDAPLPARD